MIKRLPLSEPTINGNEWKYVKECLDSGWVSSAGNFAKNFADAFAKYKDKIGLLTRNCRKEKKWIF